MLEVYPAWRNRLQIALLSSTSRPVFTSPSTFEPAFAPPISLVQARMNICGPRPVTVVIPPRKTARACPPKTLADVQRNESIEGIARLGRREWKKRSGYHQQGRAENTFYRYKRILGGDMLAIDFDSQQREAQIGCNILNRMSALGMPSSFRIG